MIRKLYLIILVCFVALTNGHAMRTLLAASDSEDRTKPAIAIDGPRKEVQQTLEAPSADSGEARGTTITFWINNHNGRGQTEIYRSTSQTTGFQLIETIPHNYNQYYHDEDLKPRTTFYYKLRAVDGAETSGFSQTFWMTTYSEYFKPTVSAKAINENTIEISLTDNTYFDSYYEISGTAGTGSTNDFWQEIPMVDSGRTVKLTHHPANPGTTYKYSVTAWGQDDQGNVTERDIASATTPGYANCAGLGSIERERWDNIPGYSISSIPVNTTPSSIITLNSFSTPANNGDNYGARVRGYICPPQTGSYVFYISSDDNSQLWVSTDDNPANKRLIASSNWTNPGQWDKYPSQQSAAIALTAGTKYYIEALHKEAAGLDHLQVGWKLPDGTLERPISSIRLIKYPRANSNPEVTITNPTEGQTFSAPANIQTNVEARDIDGSIERVQFYIDNSLQFEDFTAPYSYTFTNVAAGNHRIGVLANDHEGGTTIKYVNVVVSGSAAGKIYREYWNNIASGTIESVNWNSAPDEYASYTNFETQQHRGDYYGSRMRAYIVPPTTGTYTFWIASDDRSELYLSTDENPANKRFMGRVEGWTYFRQFTKYPSQKSAPVSLVAGQKYYIEALHKEGSGNDHISVQWQLPNGTMESPIPGSRLIAIDPSTSENQPPVVQIHSPIQGASYLTTEGVTISVGVGDPDGNVNQVEFKVRQGTTTTTLATFTQPPYHYHWQNPPPGLYRLIVTATDDRLATGSKEVDFFVKEPCAGAGEIYREVWTGISGTSVSSIPVNSPPNQVVRLTSLNTPNYFGNDYGSRIRGYLCVPQTSGYTFWIASDDNSELWLSTSEYPEHKVKIASVTGATQPLQWDKYPTQKSAVITLSAGHKYYIEILHKEGGGADHVAVGWQASWGMERPIPGNRLIPFEGASSSAASARLASAEPDEESAEFSLYPNPIGSSDREVKILLENDLLNELPESMVEVVSTTGRTIYSQKINCKDGCSDFLIMLENQVPPGVYVVNLMTPQRRMTRRLLVK